MVAGAGTWKAGAMQIARIAVAAAALLAAAVARPAQAPASITISGGVSLGAYESGLTYYAVEAMARQPESAGTVRTTMFLGIAFTEALALFGFVLAFIISG